MQSPFGFFIFIVWLREEIGDGEKCALKNWTKTVSLAPLFLFGLTFFNLDFIFGRFYNIIRISMGKRNLDQGEKHICRKIFWTV